MTGTTHGSPEGRPTICSSQVRTWGWSILNGEKKVQTWPFHEQKTMLEQWLWLVCNLGICQVSCCQWQLRRHMEAERKMRQDYCGSVSVDQGSIVGPISGFGDFHLTGNRVSLKFPNLSQPAHQTVALENGLEALLVDQPASRRMRTPSTSA